MPLRIIPERSELAEHLVQSARAKDGGVFDDNEARADLFDEAKVFSPEPRLFAAKARHSSGEADVLTREASADDISGSNAVPNKSGCGELSHVVIDMHSRPMFRQNSAWKILNLAESHSLETGPFKTERESSNAGK